MARYMETAAKARLVANEILSYVSEDCKPQLAELLARLFNLGIRCSPRGVHHTVRLNAVQCAMLGLPVHVTMKQLTNDRTGRTYNALVTIGKGQEAGTVEGAEEDE